MTKSIFITTGGTGGHIIPATTIANDIINFCNNNKKDGKKQDYNKTESDEINILLIGDSNIKKYQKSSDLFSSITISTSKINRSLIGFIASIGKIFLGFLQSCFLILKYQVSNVFINLALVLEEKLEKVC